MSRHISDHDKNRSDAARAREYMRIEQDSAPNRSARALHRRPVEGDRDRRLAQYARIERGREA